MFAAGTMEPAWSLLRQHSSPSTRGELERLAQWRERGILSDEELEAKKKQILGI